jgi:hypothetical protein
MASQTTLSLMNTTTLSWSTLGVALLKDEVLFEAVEGDEQAVQKITEVLELDGDASFA